MGNGSLRRFLSRSVTSFHLSVFQRWLFWYVQLLDSVGSVIWCKLHFYFSFLGGLSQGKDTVLLSSFAWGKKFSLIFLFTISPLSSDAFGKAGVLPLVPVISIRVRYLASIITWLFFLVNYLGHPAYGLKAQESLGIKELGKEAHRQRCGTCIKAQDSTSVHCERSQNRSLLGFTPQALAGSPPLSPLIFRVWN